MEKYDYISELAENTAFEIVQNQEEWKKYLTTAARLYKYPFREQLLIYAQRPDATACASIEIWNERMHCWVKKGAKGIALLDDADRGKKLKYVFDVADVYAAKQTGRYPQTWKLYPEHEASVLNHLEQIYGATDPQNSFEVDETEDSALNHTASKNDAKEADLAIIPAEYSHKKAVKKKPKLL